jgi:ABC-type transporter Mla subunit MlaD
MLKRTHMKTNDSGGSGKWAKCLGFSVLLIWLVGCSSVGFKTGDTTATSFQKASRQVQAESRALDATIAALDDLVSSPATDLKPQFKTFSRCLDRMVDSVEQTDKAIARTREQSGEYFNAWDEELDAMNYGIIRSHSESRKSAVSNQVESVCQRYEETQAVVRPLISYFTDIQKALGTDLTAEGVTAVKEIVRKAGENTRKTQLGLAQLTNELCVSGDQLSSVIVLKKPTVPGSSTSSASRVDDGLQ